MCNSTPIEDWTTVPIDEDSLPDCLSMDDAPLAWRNVHNDTHLVVRPDPRDGKEWAVAGSNSLIRTADSVEEAKEKARQYMRKTTRPGGMV
jgi:hypothetical protein